MCIWNDTWNGTCSWNDRSIVPNGFSRIFFQKVQLLAAAVLVTVCALIYQKDLLNFDAYIPRQEDIKALNLDMMTLSGDMTDYVKEQEDGTFSIEDSTSWEKRENAFPEKTESERKPMRFCRKLLKIRKTESSDMKENRQKKELFAVCSWGISFGQAEK